MTTRVWVFIFLIYVIIFLSYKLPNVLRFITKRRFYFYLFGEHFTLRTGFICVGASLVHPLSFFIPVIMSYEKITLIITGCSSSSTSQRNCGSRVFLPLECPLFCCFHGVWKIWCHTSEVS